VRFRASELASALGTTLVGDDVTISGADFDSRTIERGQLFVPIVAARNGHDFVASAVESGAVAYLTSQGQIDGAAGATAIPVADTAAALRDAATWARQRTDAAVVAITGSVGKTTTKDMTAAALATELLVSANRRSFNNDQGLPVTILNADDRSDALVVEMGMRGFGEIARLCRIASPRIGVVTKVGASHTERLGGLPGVAVAKRELVESLTPSGTAILNADDPHVDAMAAHTEAGVLRFGTSSSADVHVSNIQLDGQARARFAVTTPWGRADVGLGVSGAHMVHNAAAALCVAGTLGVGLDAAIAAIGAAAVSDRRMQRHVLASGAVVVDDGYNANPTSVRAALEALAAMEAERRVVVLGLMAEIEDADTSHREIAQHARSLGLELVPVGTDLYGVAPVDDVRAALGVLGRGDVVLCKGSLVARMDRVVARILDADARG